VAALAEQVAQLAGKVETLEAALAAAGHPAAARPRDGSGEDGGRYFPDLRQFVNLWLLPTFRRPLSALGMADWHWCPRWAAHAEAWLVFGALWDQWETNRLEQLGMIEFTRDVVEMLPTLCGGDGPFARCRMAAAEGGFVLQRHEQVPAAPVVPAPPGWWEGWWQQDEPPADGQVPQLMFPGLEEFATSLLLPTFRRDLNAVGMRRWNWCDQWWRHDELVHNAMNLWYLFEARAAQGRLVEFDREVYYLWPLLLGDAGPVRECVPTGKPGGPRHSDLTIAPVDRETTSRPAPPGEGWLHALATAPSPRTERVGPLSDAPLHATPPEASISDGPGSRR
jgi:hypothetical protein